MKIMMTLLCIVTVFATVTLGVQMFASAVEDILVHKMTGIEREINQ